MELHARITDIRPDSHHRFRGTLSLNGADHHATFLRVKEGSIIEPLDDAPEDVKEMFEDMQGLHEGAYNTLRLPGVSGRFVMLVFPFAD